MNENFISILAAFISLTSQNAAVVACAVFVALTFHFRSFLLEGKNLNVLFY